MQAAVERAALLQQRRLRLSTESSEERVTRLQLMSDRLASEPLRHRNRERPGYSKPRLANKTARLRSETQEERAARLHRNRERPGYSRSLVNKIARLRSETQEERAARLHRVSACRQQRLGAETREEREVRLHVDRERHREQQSLLPMFKQPSVRAKMHKFYAHMVALDVSRCIHF